MRLKAPFHIMGEDDYKLQWVLPENTWWLRLWAWMWYSDKKDATLCNLFWGYLLMLVGLLPVRLFLAGAGAAVDLVGEVFAASAKSRAERKGAEGRPKASLELRNRPVRGRLFSVKINYWYEAGIWDWDRLRWSIVDSDGNERPIVVLSNLRFRSPEEPGAYELVARPRRNSAVYGEQEPLRLPLVVQKRPGLFFWMLESIGDVGAKFFMWAKNPVPSLVFSCLAIAAGATAIGGALFLSGWGVYLAGALFVGAVPAIASFFSALPSEAASAAASGAHWVSHGFPGAVHVAETYGPKAAGGGVAVALFALAIWGLYAFGLFAALRTLFILPAAHGTKHGTLSFLKMLVLGYKAVKGGTCPRIVVEEKDR